MGRRFTMTVVCFTLAGCASVSVNNYPLSVHPEPVPADAVTILNGPPRSWYTPVAELRLSGSVALEESKLKSRLQNDAGKAGGNGVIVPAGASIQSTPIYNPESGATSFIYSQVMHAVAVLLTPIHRAAIPPDAVRIYAKKAKLPRKYEIIAERSCPNDSTVFDELRNGASQLGANAVFLGAKSSSASQLVGKGQIIAVAALVP